MNLFGDEFEIKPKEKKVKDLVKKVKEPIKVDPQAEVEKMLKSKKLSLTERLDIIKANVLKILGKQKDNILVIKDLATFNDYISAAIASGRIAVDTETNNSLDPVTCKLMGLCLYYPGGKQAYIPVNHRDPETKEKLAWQLTEKDCYDQLKRVTDSHTPVIMHNGKFDYEVISCTCGIKVKPYWDTMVCARLLNENERAGLKEQYTSKIDKSQEKYHIDELFENVNYADVEPEIFALYAATDSMMTDKLYEVQSKELEKEEYGPHMDLLGTHEIKGLRWLFHEVEMPIVVVTAEMEMTGVTVDEEYGARLKEKYDTQLNDCDAKINEILTVLQPTIAAWKASPAANEKLKTYAAKKSKMSKEKLEATYPNEDAYGRYKLGKALIEMLEDPINLSSPSQLAILFYDILKVKDLTVAEIDAIKKKFPAANDVSAEPAKIVKAKKDLKDALDKAVKERADKNATERKTGKDDLKSIKEKLVSYLPKLEEVETEFDEEDLEDSIEEAIEKSADANEAFRFGNAAKLADLLLERRKLTKVITTYIDVIPELAKHWPDGRIRFHLNALGTDTGRYSSGGKLKFMENDEAVTVSGINIQNIPSHNPEIRMLFKAAPGCRIVGSDYSAQEPRMTTFLSGDTTMYSAYNEGKDLYAMIAQSAFDNNYEDNLEFWPEGTELDIDGQKVIAGKKTHLNKAGKERRSVGKVLNLAATYGMGGATAGARLGKSREEGEQLLTNFFKGFPGVKSAIDNSKQFLRENGYVEDFLGRRRRLTDINLNPYEVQLKAKPDPLKTFNPLLECENKTAINPAIKIWEQIIAMYIILSNVWHMRKDPDCDIKNEVPNMTFETYKKIAGNPKYYLPLLEKPDKKPSAYNKTRAQKIMSDYNDLLEVIHYNTYRGDLLPDRADFKNLLQIVYLNKYGMTQLPELSEDMDPVVILAWTGRIAQAERQCFNARIQGSAASLTKLAMIDIFNDEILNKCQTKLIIPVHDELLVECPEEYADIVEKRLPEVMINAAKRGGDDVPQSCDPYNVTRWYSDTAAATVMDEFKKLETKGKLRDEALAEVIKLHSEVPKAAIIKSIETGCDLEF